MVFEEQVGHIAVRIPRLACTAITSLRQGKSQVARSTLAAVLQNHFPEL
jgi:hypothetical protein